ncbi:MAG: T9SS type A sorting domain-containing protein, partial [Ignavibacteriaceae bacterium]|nr:T9SS type A sorting domain-containing protein [Ignavibacteriaceae bacterium]
LYAGTRLRVKVKDSGQTTSGAVLRSDAVKAMFIQEVLGAGNDGDVLPFEFSLEQNYPNPFNPSTMITFALPEESEVQVRLYDVLGQQIKVLCDGVKKAGRHNIVFESDGLSGGVYIYTMNAGNFSSAKKMVFLK